ncbi:MAG: tetratricopeptide repeat protein [Salibacteraceae bacterium]
MFKHLVVIFLFFGFFHGINAQTISGKKIVKQAKVLVENGNERAAISLMVSNFNESDKSVDLLALELSKLYVKAHLLDSSKYYLRYVESAKLMDESTNLTSKVDSLKEQYNIAILTAWKSFDNKDYQNANASFSEALTYDIGHYEGYLGKSEILLIEGDHQQAIVGFKEALTKYFPNKKEQAHAYEHLAEAYLVERDAFQAIKVCDLGLGLDPENRGLVYFKAKGKYFQRLFLESKELFTQYLRFYPEDPQVNHYIGSCWYYLRNYKEAIPFFSSAIKFNGINENYNLRGRSYYEEGNYDLAIKDFQKLSSQYNDNFYAFNALGVSNYAYAKYDSAVVYMEKAVELSPTFAYQFNLIKAYMANGQNKLAISLCNKMAEKYRASNKLNVVHCEALINEGDYKSAKEWLEGSVQLNPYVKEYFELAELIYQKLGDIDSSKDYKSRGESVQLSPLNFDLTF